jgi:hypothetical protein
MNTKSSLVLGAVIGLATTRLALADPTALELIKNGDNYVGVQSRDKILQIYSEKSVASLTPNIWHVEYYDPDFTFKTVDVKFGAGQEMEVSHPIHPMRPFALPPTMSDILDQSKLRVDSDRALSIATSQPLLKGLTLRATKMTLENGDAGPVWRVEIYAAKLNDPDRDVSLGTVSISADDGSVVKLDLEPANVD